jgi:hypothetical protein
VALLSPVHREARLEVFYKFFFVHSCFLTESGLCHSRNKRRRSGEAQRFVRSGRCVLSSDDNCEDPAIRSLVSQQELRVSAEGGSHTPERPNVFVSSSGVNRMTSGPSRRNPNVDIPKSADEWYSEGFLKNCDRAKHSYNEFFRNVFRNHRLRNSISARTRSRSRTSA